MINENCLLILCWLLVLECLEVLKNASMRMMCHLLLAWKTVWRFVGVLLSLEHLWTVAVKEFSLFQPELKWMCNTHAMQNMFYCSVFCDCAMMMMMSVFTMYDSINLVTHCAEGDWKRGELFNFLFIVLIIKIKKKKRVCKLMKSIRKQVGF